MMTEIDADLGKVLKYFQDFQINNYPDSAFIYGVARKVTERVQNLDATAYPVFHLERPFIVSENNGFGELKENFIFIINAFDKYSQGGTVDENDLSEIIAEVRTLRMLQALQRQLNHDSAEGLFEFEIAGNEKNPIQDNYVQYHTGWQLTVRVSISAGAMLC